MAWIIRISFPLVLLIFLLRCSEPVQKDEPFDTLKDMWNADNVRVTYLKKKNSEEQDSVVIEMIGVHIKENYSLERITSTSALLFLQKLKSSQKKEISYVQVIVRNKNGLFKKSYSKKDLLFLQNLFPKLNYLFGGAFEKKNHDSIFDSRVFNDSDVDKVYKLLGELKEVHGEVKQNNLVGFSFNGDTNKYVKIWQEVQYGNTLVKFDVEFLMDSEKIKFIRGK